MLLPCRERWCVDWRAKRTDAPSIPAGETKQSVCVGSESLWRGCRRWRCTENSKTFFPWILRLLVILLCFLPFYMGLESLLNFYPHPQKKKKKRKNEKKICIKWTEVILGLLLIYLSLFSSLSSAVVSSASLECAKERTSSGGPLVREPGREKKILLFFNV